MEDKKKNRDPEKARARAYSDLRCAARKLGLDVALRELVKLNAEELAKKAGAA